MGILGCSQMARFEPTSLSLSRCSLAHGTSTCVLARPAMLGIPSSAKYNRLHINRAGAGDRRLGEKCGTATRRGRGNDSNVRGLLSSQYALLTTRARPPAITYLSVYLFTHGEIHRRMGPVQQTKKKKAPTNTPTYYIWGVRHIDHAYILQLSWMYDDLCLNLFLIAASRQGTPSFLGGFFWSPNLTAVVG